MTAIIERMAKAAHDSLMGFPETSEWPKSAFSVDADMFRDAVRASLATIRQPNREMVLDCINGDYEEFWRCMIDAILNEKPT